MIRPLPLPAATVLALGWTLLASPVRAQEGRSAALALDFPPLSFDPPEPSRHTLPGGVEVLHLRDRTLPLVSVHVRFRGGYAHFPREYYAAGTALPTLLRSGGTRSLDPDPLNELLDFHAVQTTFGGGGESVFSSVNALTSEIEVALGLWSEMLREPGFDSVRVEVWRGQELESVLRRVDDPGRLAFSEFNRLMYGEHPVGWEMTPRDLTPERLAEERLRWVHRRIVCPANMILGVTGDVRWGEIRPLLLRMLERWPPCPEELPELPTPSIRSHGGVFLIPRELEQSTVVMAHPTDVRQGDTPAFFASRVGNAILGSSGLSSRLVSRVRTEKGYAYSAASLWTTSRRHQGLLGALTRTRSGTTVAATRLVLEVMEEMTRAPPDAAEVERTVDETANGFVFNFESPSQIVSRQMVYRSVGLPEDWLERYLEGVGAVEPRDVLAVFREHLRPGEMTILVVGNPDAFDEPLDALGPVTILDLDATSHPGGSRRSPD